MSTTAKQDLITVERKKVFGLLLTSFHVLHENLELLELFLRYLLACHLPLIILVIQIFHQTAERFILNLLHHHCHSFHPLHLLTLLADLLLPLLTHFYCCCCCTPSHCRSSTAVSHPWESYAHPLLFSLLSLRLLRRVTSSGENR